MFSKFRLPFRDDIFFSLLAVLALLIPLVFFTFTYEKYEIIKLTVWYVCLGAAIVSLFFGRVGADWEGGKKMVRVHKPLFWLLVFMLVWAFAGALRGGDMLSSIFGFVPRYTNSLLVLGLWALTTMLILLRLTRERFLWLLKVLVFTGLANAVVAILQSRGVAYYNGPTLDVFQRAPALLGNADFSAFFMAALVPCAIFLTGQAKSRGFKIYYFLNAIVLSFAVVILSSRGAWLGLFVELPLYFLGTILFRSGKKQILVSAFVGIIAFGLWFGLANQARPGAVVSSLNLSEGNINLRFFVWDIARQAMLEHPFFGVSVGNFQNYFESRRNLTLANQDGVYDDVHNLFFQFGASMGIPFLSAFIILLGLSFAKAFRSLTKERDELALALGVALAGFCVMAGFTPVPSSCYLLLAILVAGMFLPYSKVSELSGWRVWVTAGSIVGTTAIAWGVVFFVSEILFFRGYNLYFMEQFQNSLKYMRLATALDRSNQIFYIYKAGDEARLGLDSKIIESETAHVIAMHPQDARSYHAATDIYFEKYATTKNKGDLNTAIAFLKQSIQKDFFYAQRHTQLALYLFADNQLPESSKEIQLALSFDKTSIPGWLLLARIYQEENRKDQSLYALSQVSALNPDNKILKDLLTHLQNASGFGDVVIPVGIAEGGLE